MKTACSGKVVWLDFEDYSGDIHRVYVCCGKWDDFLDCVKKVEKEHNISLGAAGISLRNCLDAAKEASKLCVKDCKGDSDCMERCVDKMEFAAKICSEVFKRYVDQIRSD